MKQLKENSILINRTIYVCRPGQEDGSKLLDMTDICLQFNGAYCTNNSTIAFITNEGVYVTPYTSQAMMTLLKNGFIHEQFHVPFSDGDYPKYQKEKWDRLRDAAAEKQYFEYETECADWCDMQGVKPLSDRRMENCYQIPRDGVSVRKFNYETVYYPICDEPFLSYITIHKLGQFCSHNDIVVFTYRDGHTYVTKGYSIIDDLIASGYKETAVYVPFSNGETIIDPEEKVKWDRIIKE